jgi:hypothetical protein
MQCAILVGLSLQYSVLSSAFLIVCFLHHHLDQYVHFKYIEKVISADFFCTQFTFMLSFSCLLHRHDCSDELRFFLTNISLCIDVGCGIWDGSDKTKHFYFVALK